MNLIGCRGGKKGRFRKMFKNLLLKNQNPGRFAHVVLPGRFAHVVLPGRFALGRFALGRFALVLGVGRFALIR